MPVTRSGGGGGSGEGPAGPAGATGPVGEQGMQGATGVAGAAGSLASAFTGLYKSRTLAAATSFFPNASRAAFVICSPQITVANGAAGAVSLMVGPAASMVAISSMESKFIDADVVNAKSLLGANPMPFIVPAGHAYELKQVSTLGSPVFLLGNAFEILL